MYYNTLYIVSIVSYYTECVAHFWHRGKYTATKKFNYEAKAGEAATGSKLSSSNALRCPRKQFVEGGSGDRSDALRSPTGSSEDLRGVVFDPASK